MKTFLTGPMCLAIAVPMLSASAYAQDFDLPPNAKPGQCWSRVLAPARYETVTENVVLQAASEPATFKTRTETVVVEPARDDFRVVPAKYEKRSERVKVRDGYTTWKKGTGPITRIDGTTGEILCLVEVPAEYRSVEKQVLVSAAKTERIRRPAKTKQVVRRVIDKAATTRKVRMPAKVETVRFQEMVSPPSTRKIPVAAITDRVTFKKKISDESLQWAQILCETNVTPGVVRNLQTALQGQGLYQGAIDGKLGSGTMAAVDAYQRRNNLSTGSLTIETLNKLRIPTARV